MIRTCFVYFYINLITAEVYVGKTHNLRRRHNTHRYAAKTENSHFYNAVRKYGWDLFIHRVVATHASDEEAYAGEIRLIAELRRLRFKLYNEQRGGDGPYDATLERRAKMSASQKGRKLSQEHCAAISAATKGENNPMFGKKHSAESIAKNSSSNQIATAGDKNGMFGKKHSEKSRAAMSNSHKGRQVSAKTRALWSQRQSGAGNSFFGKKHSVETIEKIQKAANLRSLIRRTAAANLELAPIDVWL